MSELSRFRDHARQMATAEHKPECPATAKNRWDFPPDIWRKYTGCAGCNPAVDRERFAALADEVDAYLDRPTEAEDLFGEVTAEPVRESEDA